MLDAQAQGAVQHAGATLRWQDLSSSGRVALLQNTVSPNISGLGIALGAEGGLQICISLLMYTDFLTIRDDLFLPSGNDDRSIAVLFSTPNATTSTMGLQSLFQYGSTSPGKVC